MEYNKLNILLLSLNRKKNALDFLFFLSNNFGFFEAWLPAGVWENEPTLKRKSPQTGIQAMEYTFR